MSANGSTKTSPLAPTFALLATKQLTAAIRTAIAEIGSRGANGQVSSHLASIISEIDDLETFLAYSNALPEHRTPPLTVVPAACNQDPHPPGTPS